MKAKPIFHIFFNQKETLLLFLRYIVYGYRGQQKRNQHETLKVCIGDKEQTRLKDNKNMFGKENLTENT